MPNIHGDSPPTVPSQSVIQPHSPSFHSHSTPAQIELETFNRHRPQSHESVETSPQTTLGNKQSQPSRVPRKGTPKRRPPPIIIAGLLRSSLDSKTQSNSSSEDDLDGTQMGRNPRRSPSSKLDRAESTSSRGQHSEANGSMEPNIRRKHPSLESPTGASQTARLMGRENFSLNDEPPHTPKTPDPLDTSFFDLPRQDKRNSLLLVLLYFLQGIPIGLAMGSVPIILKRHLSYGQIGVFSLASYPYSLKLLWSPIVDAVWSPKVGRRKSWILPIQMVSGLGMIYLGSRVEQMMKSAGSSDGSGVWTFTWWWFFLVFLCATQDIAVDGKDKVC